MFDTMTMTKTVGAGCGALLIFLLGGWAADTLYSSGESGHGDGENQAYRIDTGETLEMAAEEVEQVPFAEIFAAADAGQGERLWRQCQACHSLESGKNGTGPSLAGVVDRARGSVAGYSFSNAVADLGGQWTPENLSGFLENPRDYASGTKMAYKGMKDVEDRANLIAYLATIAD